MRSGNTAAAGGSSAVDVNMVGSSGSAGTALAAAAAAVAKTLSAGTTSVTTVEANTLTVIASVIVQHELWRVYELLLHSCSTYVFGKC
jgi:hypothetical protein